MRGQLGHVNSLRCGGRQGIAALAPQTTRRALSLLSENVRRVLSENVRSMCAGPRALDAAAMNARADRRRKNKSSSVRLAILAAASRVRSAALRDLGEKQSLPKEEERKDSIIAKQISIATAPGFCIRWSRGVARTWGARFGKQRCYLLVQATISELGIVMVEMQLTFGGDMHHYLASGQTRLIFFTENLQCQTTVRDSVISFDLALGGGGEEAVQIQFRAQRAPGTLRIARRDGEALVVSGDKSFEEQVGLLQ